MCDRAPAWGTPRVPGHSQGIWQHSCQEMPLEQPPAPGAVAPFSIGDFASNDIITAFRIGVKAPKTCAKLSSGPKTTQKPLTETRGETGSWCSAWRGLGGRGLIFYSAADFLDGTKYIIYLHFQNENNLFLLICSSTTSCWRQLCVAQYSRVSSPLK